MPKRISELNAPSSPLNAGDSWLVVDSESEGTKKVTPAELLTLIGADDLQDQIDDVNADLTDVHAVIDGIKGVTQGNFVIGSYSTEGEVTWEVIQDAALPALRFGGAWGYDAKIDIYDQDNINLLVRLTAGEEYYGQLELYSFHPTDIPHQLIIGARGDGAGAQVLLDNIECMRFLIDDDTGVGVTVIGNMSMYDDPDTHATILGNSNGIRIDSAPFNVANVQFHPAEGSVDVYYGETMVARFVENGGFPMAIIGNMGIFDDSGVTSLQNGSGIRFEHDVRFMSGFSIRNESADNSLILNAVDGAPDRATLSYNDGSTTTTFIEYIEGDGLYLDTLLKIDNNGTDAMLTVDGGAIILQGLTVTDTDASLEVPLNLNGGFGVWGVAAPAQPTFDVITDGSSGTPGSSFESCDDASADNNFATVKTWMTQIEGILSAYGLAVPA